MAASVIVIQYQCHRLVTSSYRPIFNLPYVSQLIECIVVSRLVLHFPPLQSGAALSSLAHAFLTVRIFSGLSFSVAPIERLLSTSLYQCFFAFMLCACHVVFLVYLLASDKTK